MFASLATVVAVFERSLILVVAIFIQGQELQVEALKCIRYRL